MKKLYLIFILLILSLYNSFARVNVVVKKITKGTILKKLMVTGEVRPYLEAYITSDINGRVEKVFVETGEFVKKGEVLIELEKSRYKIALEQAKANYLIAKENAKTIEKDFKRTKILYQKKVINDKTYDQVRANYIILKNRVKLAEAALKLAKLNYTRTSIKSKISGFFVQKNVNVGQTITPGIILGRVIDLKKVFVYAKVSEDKISEITKNQVCIFENGMTGEVKHIGLYADKSRAFLIKVLVNNPQLTLKANMFLKGEIILKTFKNVPIIPYLCILKSKDKRFVFIVKQNKAYKKHVTLIAKDKNLCFVKGVDEGDLIVTTGRFNLKNKDEVNIIKEEK